MVEVGVGRNGELMKATAQKNPGGYMSDMCARLE
jgi:hypothetical protein